jgi:hypothetical protein
MLLGILCPRFWKGPDALREIELVRTHPCNLLPSLPCEGQKFNDAAIGAADLSSREDHLRELLIGEHSVAGNLLGRQRDPLGRRLIKNGSAHAPAQERLDRLQGLVGGDGCPPLLDR